MNKKCQLRYGLPALICILAITAAVYACFFASFSHDDTTQFVYIDNDDNLDSLNAKLDTIGNWYALTGFKTLTRHSQYAENMRTGRFAVEPGQSTLSLFRKLKNGIQSPIRLTIPSVRTIDRLTKELARHIMADSTAIADVLNDSAEIALLGYNRQTLPALFIPNTYEVYWNIAPKSLLLRMHKEHKRFWGSERQARADALHLTETQVATLASIVDEETTNDAEKPTIAGLYYNRLQHGMLLQADPTVKYAVGDFTLQRIYNYHLTIDNPYNTYRYKGLPPGPIRIPSVAGIDAVLHMQRHNYLYMCAKEDFSGTHNFAATLAEHQQNARRYVQALNARGIR